VDVTVEAYKDMAVEEAQKIIASLIQQGVFREESGWLIPLAVKKWGYFRRIKPNDGKSSLIIGIFVKKLILPKISVVFKILNPAFLI